LPRSSQCNCGEASQTCQAAVRAGGPVAGEHRMTRGPTGAQPWATARPSGLVSVRHQRVPELAASRAARSLHVPASAGPKPATSPGTSS
jgi:hypothetical protein